MGHAASRLTDVEMLTPLLKEVDHLILAGDVYQQRFRDERGDYAAGMMKDLLDLTTEKNIRLTVVRGNHDPEGGVGVAWLQKKQILVTHGDAIYDDATPWSREILSHRGRVNEIVEEYRPRAHSAAACAERAQHIAQMFEPLPLPRLPVPLNFFATALWPPHRPLEMFRVWRGLGHQGLRFLAHSGEGAKVLICGHFHHAGAWSRNGRLILNTGSFMKGSRTWAVDVSGPKITARLVTQSRDSFRPAEVQGRWLIR